MTAGRTDLLDGFVSSRTNRKFKAFLVRQPDGKVGFEFEPRGDKPGRPGAAAKKAAGKTATKTAAKAPAKTAAKKAVKKAAPKKAATKTAAKKAAKKSAA